MATIRSVKQLAADVEKGDVFAAFLICKRRRLKTIHQLVLLVRPIGVIDASTFDTVSDGWFVYRRYLSDDLERETLERLSVA